MTDAVNAHPTADEWAARQKGLPAAARDTLYAHMMRLEAKELERIEAHRKAEEAGRKWRDAFEAAVAAVLAQNNAEWLSEYRVPDHGVSYSWCGESTSRFLAVFDPSAVGVWPIQLELNAAAAPHDNGKPVWEWSGAVAFPWTAFVPRGCQTFRTYPEALAAAVLTRRVTP